MSIDSSLKRAYSELGIESPEKLATFDWPTHSDSIPEDCRFLHEVLVKQAPNHYPHPNETYTEMERLFNGGWQTAFRLKMDDLVQRRDPSDWLRSTIDNPERGADRDFLAYSGASVYAGFDWSTVVQDATEAQRVEVLGFLRHALEHEWFRENVFSHCEPAIAVAGSTIPLRYAIELPSQDDVLNGTLFAALGISASPSVGLMNQGIDTLEKLASADFKAVNSAGMSGRGFQETRVQARNWHEHRGESGLLPDIAIDAVAQLGILDAEMAELLGTDPTKYGSETSDGGPSVGELARVLQSGAGIREVAFHLPMSNRRLTWLRKRIEKAVYLALELGRTRGMVGLAKRENMTIEEMTALIDSVGDPNMTAIAENTDRENRERLEGRRLHEIHPNLEWMIKMNRSGSSFSDIGQMSALSSQQVQDLFTKAEADDGQVAREAHAEEREAAQNGGADPESTSGHSKNADPSGVDALRVDTPTADLAFLGSNAHTALEAAGVEVLGELLSISAETLETLDRSVFQEVEAALRREGLGFGYYSLAEFHEHEALRDLVAKGATEGITDEELWYMFGAGLSGPEIGTLVPSPDGSVASRIKRLKSTHELPDLKMIRHQRQHRILTAIVHLMAQGFTDQGVSETLVIGPKRAKELMETARRGASMMDQYLNGLTLEEIGETEGVTRERVRQLIARVSPSGSLSRVSSSARKQNRSQETDRQRTAALASAGVSEARVVQKYKSCWDLEATAKTLNLELKVIAWVLDRAGISHLSRRGGSGGAQQYTDEQLISYLRLMAEELETDRLTMNMFRGYAPTQTHTPEAWPTAQVYGLRFGSWTEACAAAGLAAGRPLPKYHVTFPPQRCIEAVVSFLQECEENARRPTFRGFDEWVRVNPGQPSGATVRNKLGPWRDAVRLAQISRNRER